MFTSLLSKIQFKTKIMYTLFNFVNAIKKYIFYPQRIKNLIKLFTKLNKNN